VKPARENINLLKERLTVLDSQIAAQEVIKRQRKDIDARLKITGAAASANEAYLYSAAQSDSLAMVDLQDFVKSTAISTRLEVQSSIWGEPVDDPKIGLTKIPMTFAVKGLPADLDAFLRKLLYGRRFIKVERATLSKVQDQQLLLNFSMLAFKRDGRHD
jgi:hypothetical protein